MGIFHGCESVAGTSLTYCCLVRAFLAGDYNFGKRRLKLRGRGGAALGFESAARQGNWPGIASSSSVTRLPREIQHREALKLVTLRFRGYAVLRHSSLATLECNPRTVIEILTRSALLDNQRVHLKNQ